VSTVNGSGGRRKKEVWCLYGCRSFVPASRLVTPPGTKDRGQLLPDGAVGSPPSVMVGNTSRD
jgi:hypothetical protein